MALLPRTRLSLSVSTIAILAALGSLLPAAAQQVGVNSAVNPDASGTPPNEAPRQLLIGQQVVHNERIHTGAGGQTQILFLDESAMTVGPNSDVTIDEFVYDPNTGKGRLAMSATAGVLRFVGGKLSKNEDAVTLQTPSASIGVRGGIFLANLAPGGKLDVVFLYGQGLTVTGVNCGPSCAPQTITRPGFAVSVAAIGAPPSSPSPAPPSLISNTLSQFSGQPGKTGGSSDPPSDSSVAASGVENVISGNVAASVQQATQNAQLLNTFNPTPTITSPLQTATTNLNTVSITGDPVVAMTYANPKPAGTPIPSATPTPTPTPTPAPTGVLISGLVKVAPIGSRTGFTDQTASGRIPYNGTIVYAGPGMTNGTATGTASSIGVAFTLSPLNPGSYTSVTATATGADYPAIGTAYESADGDFFFANLTGTGGSQQQFFVMGGTPVASSFFQPQANAQYLSFNILPDATLGANGQQQTIPFLPGIDGGTMAGAVVSPLLVVNPANTGFGSHSNQNNDSALGTIDLQADLVINGSGANQSSALLVSTGAFSTSADTFTVNATGQLRGTVFTSATSPLLRISSNIHSVPDANNNSLYGGSTIDGFVLDQNEQTLAGTYQLNTATAGLYQSGSGITNTSYAFNQPVVSNGPFTPGARAALNETGYFGGVLQCCSSNATTNAIINYGLTGSVSLTTDPNSDRVAATFVSGAPFFAVVPSGSNSLSLSGLKALTLQFGSLPSQGDNDSRSAFIDDNDFAALENPNVSSLVTRDINGSPQTTVVPTLNSATNSNYEPSLALVTQNIVQGTSFFPGVTFCQCQYSQWGFWTGSVQSPNNTSGYANGITSDIASIDTWLAGTPTVTLPTVGVGVYTGAAVGSVYNNGAQYLAAGNVLDTYNFASNLGTITFSNFDGNTFSGILSGNSGTYAGSVSGAAVSGYVTGSFFGPNAAETGGSFGVSSPTGSYVASGIYDAASANQAVPAFTTYASGLLKTTNAMTASGYSNQGTGNRIPYTGGTITYPTADTPQNGVFSENFGAAGQLTLTPITPGMNNQAVTATQYFGGTGSGTATMTADGDFFYANLTGTGPAAQSFVFGGVPVSPTVLLGPSTQQFLAFSIQPDAALANGTQAQTIPFLPPNFGGTMSNAVVSPYYLELPAGAPLGSFNTSNDRAAALQATLAITGTGAAQTSAFVLMTGNLFQSSTTNTPNVEGIVRGTVLSSATSPAVQIGSGALAVPDANGNNLFGGNSISGFVLDQNNNNNGVTQLQLASADQFGSSTATNYAFNQPLTVTTTPSGIGTLRSALNETGYFGGIMSQSASGTPFILTGATSVQTDPSSSRIAATFSGADPYTSSQSGISSMSLQFGSLPSAGQSSRGRSSFIDNNTYGAAENPYTPSQINGTSLPTNTSTQASNLAPSLAMVTVGTLGPNANSWMPAGVTPCSCQYLQWGYWTGGLGTPNSAQTGYSQYNRAYIGTWIAGQPTVNMPTSGTGTFNGAAVGTVSNNGATYLAAGSFNQTYNFGSRAGTVTISNFDGTTYTSSVTGSGNAFAGSITSGSRSGAVAGTFFGPGAVETGGSFNIHAISGPTYIASGIFAGR